MTMQWFSLARLRAMLMKEFIQMWRDHITFAMMLIVAHAIAPVRFCDQQ